MAFYSSQPRFDGSILIGTMEAGSNINLAARYGDNGYAGQSPEVTLALNQEVVQSLRVTWDPIHADRTNTLLLGVFQVRFEVDDGACRGTAGTNAFVEATPEPFQLIRKLQIGASVRRSNAFREVEWNWADITFRYTDDTCETYSLSALPRAATPQQVRRSVQAPPSEDDATTYEQYAELRAPGNDLVAVRVVALVTFRANDPVIGVDTLGSDSLQAKIAVFTDASAGNGSAQAQLRSKVHGRAGKR